MNPAEFRIGNLVKYDGRIFKLHSIGEYPILDTIEFGAKVVEWKDLEPVEITEDVLIGMGFGRLRYGWLRNRIRFALGGKTVHIDGLWIPNRYPHAHQLQNLIFALTGEEVTLNTEQ